ncbi:hypothetical protein BV22DRAFT_1131677 [Leucogyrophana mollusca]|uniref:Uncharacterized protein n=1 Tax=Leucogyrophana mollusca TaxID=85980 RepID=A0ACB8BA92_9AGAM|nr:hypothetical protein BV22DRAFT_1131677 [Leucogyrophana mollusca]
MREQKKQPPTVDGSILKKQSSTNTPLPNETRTATATLMDTRIKCELHGLIIDEGQLPLGKGNTLLGHLFPALCITKKVQLGDFKIPKSDDPFYNARAHIWGLVAFDNQGTNGDGGELTVVAEEDVTEDIGETDDRRQRIRRQWLREVEASKRWGKPRAKTMTSVTTLALTPPLKSPALGLIDCTLQSDEPIGQLFRSMNSKVFDILRIIWSSFGFIGQGRTVYHVKLRIIGIHYVLKDYWVDATTVEHEAAILKKIKGIEGVPKLI